MRHHSDGTGCLLAMALGLMVWVTGFALACRRSMVTAVLTAVVFVAVAAAGVLSASKLRLWDDEP